MNNWTRFFLVLLRLVIGWHFLFEGLDKLGNPTWSSESYLRESAGPLAGFFQRLAGDAVIDRVTLKPHPVDAQAPPHQRFPAALEREWQAIFNRFCKHYDLSSEQRLLAEAKMRQHMDQFVLWLHEGTRRVAKSSPYGPSVYTDKKMAERVAEYQEKLREARLIQSRDLPRTAHTVFAAETQAQLRTLKAEVNRLRSEIKAEVDDRTARMKDALREVLNDQQARDYPPLPARIRPALLDMTLLDLTDVIVPWGLTVTGVCLIIGLFTRTFCVVGAVLLLLFYLAMPPLGPVVPDNLRAEGHYLYINKNIIEMVALLALATIPSGRWCGLDGLVRFFNPRNWRRQDAPVVRS